MFRGEPALRLELVIVVAAGVEACGLERGRVRGSVAAPADEEDEEEEDMLAAVAAVDGREDAMGESTWGDLEAVRATDDVDTLPAEVSEEPAVPGTPPPPLGNANDEGGDVTGPLLGDDDVIACEANGSWDGEVDVDVDGDQGPEVGGDEAGFCPLPPPSPAAVAASDVLALGGAATEVEVSAAAEEGARFAWKVMGLDWACERAV